VLVDVIAAESVSHPASLYVSHERRQLITLAGEQVNTEQPNLRPEVAPVVLDRRFTST
jgi:hypothetical protein